MDSFNLTTPVAFIIFNKVESTQKVFEVVRRVQPTTLFIIADGPRKDKPQERIVCERVRKITEDINWECKVFRNYSDENLGLRKRVMTGLDWVFDSTEEAIIIEDDCLPDESFFRYCQDMLNIYKDKEQVFTISGNKVLSDFQNSDSYYFSCFAHIWGWATWRRVWKNFNSQPLNLNENEIEGILKDNLKHQFAVKYWKTLIYETQTGVINAWSVKLQLMQFLLKGLTIIPSKNLVINLGFDNKDATNTKGSGGLYQKMKLETLTFPLIHPTEIVQNLEADEIEIKLFHKFGFKEKIRRLLLKFNIKIK